MNNLSVIVPIFNAEEYLPRCLESLKQQTYKNINFWLINDGSTDSSLEVCNKIVGDDSRFHIISQQNKGAGLSRDLGISLCDGDYVSFVDSDDWIGSEMFEKMMVVLTRESVEIVRCNTIIHRQEKEEVRWNPPFCNKVLNQVEIQKEVIPLLIAPEKEKDFNWRLLRGCVCHIFKKSLIIENNIHFSELKSGEDILFTVEVLLHSKNMFFMPDPFYHYMICNNNSLSKSSSSVGDKQRSILRQKLNNLLVETDGYEIVKRRWGQEDRRLIYLDARIAVVYSGLDKKSAKSMLRTIVEKEETKKAFSYKIPRDLPFAMYVLYTLIKHKKVGLLFIAIRLKFRKELKKQ